MEKSIEYIVMFKVLPSGFLLNASSVKFKAFAVGFGGKVSQSLGRNFKTLKEKC